MPLFVEFRIDVQRFLPVWSLRDTDQRSTFIQIIDNPIAIEGFISEQPAEVDPINQRCDADGIVSVAGQQFEAYQIAQSIRQSQYFGGQSAFRLAYGLALSPPFAPCP